MTSRTTAGPLHRADNQQGTSGIIGKFQDVALFSRSRPRTSSVLQFPMRSQITFGGAP